MLTRKRHFTVDEYKNDFYNENGNLFFFCLSHQLINTLDKNVQIKLQKYNFIVAQSIHL